MTESERDRGRENLVWAIRWLAADPEPALRALDAAFLHEPAGDRSAYVPDEIALTLGDCLEVARRWDLITPDIDAMLGEIDQTFGSISGSENAEHWTPMAVASSPLWAEQRSRARLVLAAMGQERADGDLPGHV